MTRMFIPTFAIAWLAACGGAPIRPHSEDPMGGVLCTYIPRDHFHDEQCGHYVFNNRWYYLSGHDHRIGCGHHQINKVWHFVTPVKIAPDHRHDSDCGHYYHSGKWYHVAAHRHGHGCGHIYREGWWQLD